MPKGTFIAKITGSKYLFYLLLAINIGYLFLTRFYPSGDGPVHLYNTNLIKELISGNASIGQFFVLNHFPIPNWTSHFILLVFRTFLPAWLAEKALLIIYITGMAFSFRYLIRQLNPENISLSIFIFPFLHTFLFHSGFYNFSLSFILLFFTIGFYLKHRHHDSPFLYGILFVLLSISYFTNLLIFGFIGLTLGVYILGFRLTNYRKNKKLKTELKTTGKQLSFLFLAALPSLILLSFFFKQAPFLESDQTYPFSLLLKWIDDVRPLIVYNYNGEAELTTHFFHLLLILLVLSFTARNKQNSPGLKVELLAVPLVVTILLYFITPTGAGAGMMSERYCTILYMFALTWIIARTVPHQLNGWIVLIVIGLHFFTLQYKLNESLISLGKNAESVYGVQDYVEENSIVLPVELAGSWVEHHFSNYLGVDKPMVILENYEAHVGWFPVKWNLEELPKVLAGSASSIPGLKWKNNPESKLSKQIDYILLYGNTSTISDSRWEILREVLASDYEQCYQSNDGFAILFKKK
ncbi:MAG: hypothetical protein ACERKD_21180 [Prolixibacteraceae bacterium]